VSEPIDEADDSATSPGAPGVPPAPSVTPGSAPPPPAGAVPQPPSRRGCLLLGLVGATMAGLAVVALVVGILVARDRLGDDADERAAERQEVVDETGIETGSTDLEHPPQRDIRLGACEYDLEGGVRASGTLTNWTEDLSDYRISLSFRAGEGSGAEFGSTVVTVEGVEPHATTSWAASVPARPEGSYTCRVVRIDRWATGEEPPPEGGP
jgi:hypothetical protein